MLNKQALIDQVSDITRLPRKDVEEVVNSFLDQVTDQLSRDQKINLSGFGIFEVRERKGRRGVDPRTLKPTMIPTVRVAKFRPGKTLKEAVK